MNNLVSAAKKVVIGTVAVGAISMGTAGIAAAATTAVPKHVGCVKATKALTRIEKTEARIATGLPMLKAAEAKAQKAGHSKRADRLKKRIAHYQSAAFRARLAKRASAIEARCHVPDPSATTGLSANPVTQA
jgi:hypothetical protein